MECACECQDNEEVQVNGKVEVNGKVTEGEWKGSCGEEWEKIKEESPYLASPVGG